MNTSTRVYAWCAGCTSSFTGAAGLSCGPEGALGWQQGSVPPRDALSPPLPVVLPPAAPWVCTARRLQARPGLTPPHCRSLEPPASAARWQVAAYPARELCGQTAGPAPRRPSCQLLPPCTACTPAAPCLRIRDTLRSSRQGGCGSRGQGRVGMKVRAEAQQDAQQEAQQKPPC
jgi:hypothetical protein